MKIKVGDIFYENDGPVRFYQVVKIYDSNRVRIRQIEKIETKTKCGYEFLAEPKKDCFLPRKELDDLEKRYADIVDNDKGVIKLIQYSENQPIIKLKNIYAELWDGRLVISSYYMGWMR